MFCQNCGKEIEDGSLFCGYCGASQEAPSTETASNAATNSGVLMQAVQKVTTIQQVMVVLSLQLLKHQIQRLKRLPLAL